MNQFRHTFRDFARSAGEGAKVALELRQEPERDVLVIPKQPERGFEVELECVAYGVYPSSGGWYSGSWDVTGWSAEDLRRSLAEFVDSVLNNSLMGVRCANGRPYKWTLHQNFFGPAI